mgnify:CR=1 FL=1
MKINKTLAAMIASAGLGISGQALAIATETNTEAGTVISNTATFSYDVGSENYTDTTTATTFKVDQKVDLTFTWDQTSNITANVGDDFALKLTLTNEGNKAQDFKFEAEQVVSGIDLVHLTKDDEDSEDTNWVYYNDDGTVDGSYDADDTVIASDVINVERLDNLPATTDNNSVTVWAVAKILDTSADLKEIGVEIMARAWGGSAYLTESTVDKNTNTTTLGTEYIIFAEDPDGDKTLTLAGAYTVDGTRDGGFVVLTEILVAAPIVDITKSVSVKSDPLGSTNPLAIPGSIITYEIVVSNTGTGDAPTINVTDTLSDEYKLSGLNTEVTNIIVTPADLNTPVQTGDIDSTSSNEGSTLKVFSADLDLKAKESLTITFDVELL